MGESANREVQGNEELHLARQKIIELEDQLDQLRQCDNTAASYLVCREDLGRLQSLIDSSTDLIWFLDGSKRLLLANKAAISTFMNTTETSVRPGTPLEKLLSEHDYEYFDRLFDEVLQGKNHHINITAIKKAQYAAILQPVIKDEKIIGASVFARNVTRNRQLEEELRRYEQIIASAPYLIALLDEDHNFVLANDAYLKAFQKRRPELAGSHISEFVGRHHYMQHSRPNLQKAFKGEQSQFQTWMTLPAFGPRFMSISYHPLKCRKQDPKYVVISVHDITDLKQAEDDRRRIFEVSLDMLCVSNLKGQFKELNRAWTECLGWPEDVLVNRSWLDFVDPEDYHDSSLVDARLARGESIIGFENRYRCSDGSLKWLAWSSYPDLEQQRIFSVVRDISKQKMMEYELQRLAATDPLTGANNRRNFIQSAEAELKRSQRYNLTMAVVMLDIDHFKRINDLYGHDIGDKVLKKFVACCLGELRTTDIFGRIGGEEFAAILIKTDRYAALDTCNRLLDQVGGMLITETEEPISITVSIGVTMLTDADSNIDSLLKRADRALYKAKEQGRNRVVLA